MVKNTTLRANLPLRNQGSDSGQSEGFIFHPRFNFNLYIIDYISLNYSPSLHVKGFNSYLNIEVGVGLLTFNEGTSLKNHIFIWGNHEFLRNFEIQLPKVYTIKQKNYWLDFQSKKRKLKTTCCSLPLFNILAMRKVGNSIYRRPLPNQNPSIVAFILMILTHFNNYKISRESIAAKRGI